MVLTDRLWRALTAILIGSSVLFAVTTASPVSAADGGPVVVGDMCSCTGPLGADASLTSDVMHAWANWVNAHGGIEGHHVQLIVEDDGANPGTAIDDVQTLINQDHVVAIADNTLTGASWGSYAQSHHVPVVGLGGTWDYPGYFVTGTTVDHYYGGLAVAAKRLGVKKFALIVCSEAAACAGAKAPTEAALQKVGIRLTYFTTIGFAAPNYTAECLAAKQSGATAVEVGDAASVIQHVLQDCAAQGYHPKLAENLVIYANWPRSSTFNGTVAMLATYPWPFRNAVTKEMYAALSKYAPGTLTSPHFSGTTSPSWVDGVMIEKALELSHPGAKITSADVSRGLYQFRGETLGGWIPPTTFRRNQVAENSCAFFLGVSGGKFVMPFGPRPLCY